MENKHTIYFNMCHHYRKIFNAKPTVDTSPPKALQMKNNQWKYRNTSPFQQKTPIQDIKTFNKEPFFIQDNGTITCKYYYQHHNKKEESVKNKSLTAPNKPFRPVILNTNVSSKLRSLRVYHPPRRKKVTIKETSQPSAENGDSRKEEIVQHPAIEIPVKNSKRLSFTVMERHSYSEESSEDSAYNEGEGVLSSDSRGSTPQNLTNKNQTAKLNENPLIPKNPAISHNKKSDDIVYIQFLKDITNDILKKNIFTNKALKNVFQHHLQINKYDLDQEKMLKEISKLQDRLGVPKDDKFDDENYGLGKEVSITEEYSIQDDINAVTDTQPESTKSEENKHETDIGTPKENDYSDDFSEYDNNSLNSESNQNESDHYDTSEGNDQLSSVDDDHIHDIEDESINVDGNESSAHSNEISESEVSEIC